MCLVTSAQHYFGCSGKWCFNGRLFQMMQSQLRAKKKAILKLPNGQLVAITYAHFNWDRQVTPGDLCHILLLIPPSFSLFYFWQIVFLLINDSQWRWYGEMNMVSMCCAIDTQPNYTIYRQSDAIRPDKAKRHRMHLLLFTGFQRYALFTEAIEILFNKNYSTFIGARI